MNEDALSAGHLVSVAIRRGDHMMPRQTLTAEMPAPSPATPAPSQTTVQQQTEQLRQQMAALVRYEAERRVKRGPAVVTRVVGQLLVFIEFDDKGAPVGLVFKPNKIEGYRGQQLSDLRVYEGATLARVDWDPETLLVERVLVQGDEQEPDQVAM